MAGGDKTASCLFKRSITLVQENWIILPSHRPACWRVCRTKTGVDGPAPGVPDVIYPPFCKNFAEYVALIAEFLYDNFRIV